MNSGKTSTGTVTIYATIKIVWKMY